MQTLFVYGSLRTIEGHPMHNYLRSFADLLGDASVGGIKVDVDGRAGLMISGDPNERVMGELYAIHEGASAELFEVLDRYEGCSEDDPEPHEYFRHRQDVVRVPLAGGEPSADKSQEMYEAWVYLLH